MTFVEAFMIVTSMLAGLALFLAGMNKLSDSLTMLTGGALNRFIGKLTNNWFFAFLFGTLVTAMVQSSSAITVLSVGLVNSGMIELSNAISLIIGSNLGTTMTAWVLSLNAIDGQSFLMTLIKPSTFSPFLAIIGVAMTMFCKSEKKKSIGSVLLGFAIMMIGMNLMSQGVAPLKELPELQSMLMSFQNPFIGFLFSVLFTMLIQSSDATIGIVQAFALSVGVNFGMAIPLICGAQVGTCITALVSSLGTSNNGKRTALMNLYYSLLKVIPFMLLFYGLNALLHFSFLDSSVGAIGIPFVHSEINVIGACLGIPGGSHIVAMANRTIPYSDEEKRAQENVLTMLDQNLLSNSSIALSQTDKAVVRMAETVEEAMESMVAYDPEKVHTTRILLERISSFRDQIENYITKLSANTADTKDTAFIMLLTNSCTAFGEIGVIAGNIVSSLEHFIESGGLERIQEEDRTEIRMLGSTIREIIEFTAHGYETKNATLSGMIQLGREELAGMSEILKKRHLRRIHGEKGRMYSSTAFTDLFYTQERLVDYCDIIADSLIRYAQAAGTIKAPTAEQTEQARNTIRELFKDKYEILHIGIDEEGRVIDLSF